jgi:ABC-type transport system substrate-binding protein
MMRGEVNVLHEVNPDAIDFIEEGGSIRAYPLLRPYYVSLLFNLKHPVLQRRDVRLALTEAIDRDEIVATSLRGHGIAAEGPFWPYHWAYPRGRYSPPDNAPAARARLDGAGLTVAERGGSAMPSRFAFTCLLPRDDSRFERIALVVQRQLFALGIDMQISLLNRPELEARLMSGRFEAALFDVLAGRTLGWVDRFWHSPAPGARPVLANGYSGADAALDRLRLAESDEDVRIAVADVMRALREDPPAVFLVWREEARAADRTLTIPHEQQHDMFGSLWRAQPATEDAAQ